MLLCFESLPTQTNRKPTPEILGKEKRTITFKAHEKKLSNFKILL